MQPEDPVPYPIDGVIDLHTFSPKDVKMLIPDYIGACIDANIYHLRIIHGKGTGTLRRLVQSILEKDDRVVHYQLAGPEAGGWGATLVTLNNDSDSKKKQSD